MNPPDRLPSAFLDEIEALEASYLAESDPVRQSGFGGGLERWRAEREPILQAITTGGNLLDIGCANGYLLECLMVWGKVRGIELIPHGLDLGRRLIELARRRHPDFAANFHVGNAWDWDPPRQYRYVYLLADQVPSDCLSAHLRRVMTRIVAPNGRLILGSYGSRSRGVTAEDAAGLLAAAGLAPVGAACRGAATGARFAWADHP